MSENNSLERALEEKFLSKELVLARPVGLRYERLEREGLAFSERDIASAAPADVTTGSPDVTIGSLSDDTPWPSRAWPRVASYWYFLCNQLLIFRLLAHRKNILFACAEGWPAYLFRCGEQEVVHICLSALVPPAHKTSIVPVEGYNDLSFGDSSFDGVFVDSSILLSNSVRTSLAEFRRILKPDGRLCVATVNWEYEMAGASEVYETSFKRYGGKVYLGLLKRTLRPAKEIEYIGLLDPAQSFVQKLASMKRDELRILTIADIPEAADVVTSVELIDIPQLTRTSLEDVCMAAGFSSVTVSGSPGILALKLSKALILTAPTSTPGSLAVSKAMSAPHGSSHAVTGVMNEISRCLAVSFPFVSTVENPHLVAVCIR